MELKNTFDLSKSKLTMCQQSEPALNDVQCNDIARPKLSDADLTKGKAAEVFSNFVPYILKSSKIMERACSHTTMLRGHWSCGRPAARLSKRIRKSHV